MQPQRDDEVAKWLRRKRDDHYPHSEAWEYIDWILDEYRLRADYGRSLTDSLDGLEDGLH